MLHTNCEYTTLLSDKSIKVKEDTLNENKTPEQIAAEKEALMTVEDVSSRKTNIKKYLAALTTEQADAFVAAFKAGVSVAEMAEASGMSRRAIYNTLYRHEDETGDRLVNSYRANQDEDAAKDKAVAGTD